ncbi:MAG: hypothetical protein DMG65_06600 [Candidatus Angelobacter sp. Gp1-AA117]|nr:MAG: hypothetical protein DMG65_06600 [Candidatus Angelobacter sp. Gp1-AA117]
MKGDVKPGNGLQTDCNCFDVFKADLPFRAKKMEGLDGESSRDRTDDFFHAWKHPSGPLLMAKDLWTRIVGKNGKIDAI